MQYVALNSCICPYAHVEKSRIHSKVYMSQRDFRRWYSDRMDSQLTWLTELSFFPGKSDRHWGITIVFQVKNKLLCVAFLVCINESRWFLNQYWDNDTNSSNRASMLSQRQFHSAYSLSLGVLTVYVYFIIFSQRLHLISQWYQLIKSESSKNNRSGWIFRKRKLK